jgi:hypothetical protein
MGHRKLAVCFAIGMTISSGIVFAQSAQPDKPAHSQQGVESAKVCDWEGFPVKCDADVSWVNSQAASQSCDSVVASAAEKVKRGDEVHESKPLPGDRIESRSFKDTECTYTRRLECETEKIVIIYSVPSCQLIRASYAD